MFLNSIYQDVQKQQNVALKLRLKLVFFQYSTNETAYREIIYLCPMKLKLIILSSWCSLKGQRDL